MADAGHPIDNATRALQSLTGFVQAIDKLHADLEGREPAEELEDPGPVLAEVAEVIELVGATVRGSETVEEAQQTLREAGVAEQIRAMAARLRAASRELDTSESSP